MNAIHASIRGFAICASLVTFVPAPAAYAQGVKASSAAKTTAKRENRQAKKMFAAGMFAKAAEAYRRAYAAVPAPAFLFNLAQCYRRIDTIAALERAVFYFEGFLRDAPATPIRPRVDGEIRKLQRRIRQLKRVRAAKREASKPLYKRWWFWTAIGVAAAGATAATVVAVQPGEQPPASTAGGNFRVPVPQ